MFPTPDLDLVGCAILALDYQALSLVPRFLQQPCQSSKYFHLGALVVRVHDWPHLFQETKLLHRA